MNIYLPFARKGGNAFLKHNEEDLSPLEEFVFCIMKKLFSLYNEEAQSTTIH